MDYEMFLVSRMREEHDRGVAPVEAVRAGYGKSAPVVTAAGIIMFSVFASYIVASDLITKEIAFSLAVGVAVDAFLVRLTLIPAAMALLGRSASWLPHWLDRILPSIDVEGAGLELPLQPAGAAS
jgi:RND superfamily putative drug exporter